MSQDKPIPISYPFEMWAQEAAKKFTYRDNNLRPVTNENLLLKGHQSSRSFCPKKHLIGVWKDIERRRIRYYTSQEARHDPRYITFDDLQMDEEFEDTDLPPDYYGFQYLDTIKNDSNDARKHERALQLATMAIRPSADLDIDYQFEDIVTLMRKNQLEENKDRSTPPPVFKPPRFFTPHPVFTLPLVSTPPAPGPPVSKPPPVFTPALVSHKRRNLFEDFNIKKPKVDEGSEDEYSFEPRSCSNNFKYQYA